MTNKQPEEGSIQLDNQCIQVRILMPSGRFQVTDKVSGVVWNMKTGHSSGQVVFRSNDTDAEYRFGIKGKRGILFHSNYYMLRSTDTEDFHDVSLEGDLGDDKETKITIRYLLSTTFPILNCYCYVSGKQEDQLYSIKFPLGLRLADNENNHIWLPKSIADIKKDNINIDEELHQPPKNDNHRVVGAPFFILTKRKANYKSCGCIGFVQHPLSIFDIFNEKNERFVHPSSSRLDKTGKTIAKPYYFRYQFVPSDDPHALSWLYREYLLEQENQISLLIN